MSACHVYSWIWGSSAHADHSLFTHITSSSYMALLIYVDDIVLVGDHKAELTHLKQILDSKLWY